MDEPPAAEFEMKKQSIISLMTFKKINPVRSISGNIILSRILRI